MGLALTLAVLMVLSLTIPAFAGSNPTVAITVTAEVVSITNDKDTWGIGTITVDAVVYFSATGTEDDDYSQIENTGNVAVDVEIQGTDIEGGDYDWTLSNTGTAGSETYALHANSEATPAVYDVIVKSESYTDICTNLAASGTYDWSMKFTAPTAFNAADDGLEKSSTVTLVATKHT